VNRQKVRNRIKQARQDAGLTQAEVARLLDIKRASVSQWESGLTSPTTAKLAQLAQVTRRPLGWFLIEDDDEAQRAAHSRVSDATVNSLGALPPLLRALAEKRVADLMAYARTLPTWASLQPPSDVAALEALEREVEQDMRARQQQPAPAPQQQRSEGTCGAGHA
jgi:transcriptional regulator with XRE-family HTH domain